MRSGINRDKVVRLKTAQAAGQTAINSDVVDCSGAESVEFQVHWGTITATGVQSVKAQQGAAANLSDAADLKDTSISVPDSASGKITRLEIIRPEERYLRAVVSRGTANSVVDSIVAILRYPKKQPVVQDATIQGAEIHPSPIEGTA